MFNFNSKNIMTEEEIMGLELKNFINSSQRQWMITGDKYYRVDNDIKNRTIVKQTNVGAISDKYKSNNKLAHGKIKNLIDEKVAYLLSKDYTLECDDKKYIDKVKLSLGRQFQYILTGLGYEASNKGIAWLQPYINKVGEFKLLMIPSEQCCPIWKDSTHTELQAMIRFYNQIIYEGKEKKLVTKVEYWTEQEVSFYIYEDNNLILDIEKELQNNGPILHFKKGEQWISWGRVPFIAFKNNRLEYPDIRFIKSLIDNYDLARSEVANFIEDTKNLIYVLKGYGGQDLGEFMNELNFYRAIKIDDAQDGGVETLNPKMDITAVREHYNQLKRDIIEYGQGVNKDLDKFGSAPSGIALKFLYSGLDLKCNALEVEFKMGFEQLLYFISTYLQETDQGSFFNGTLDIIFNRDININQKESIENCLKSKGIISDETIMANHPWVKDVEKELGKFKNKDERIES